ncbi:hypothetical protein BJX99DRAFT_240201 [Aspergillus californicus]
MPPVLEKGKTALITGAASGIGFAIAKLCRSKRMHLALLDVDIDNLPKARSALEQEDSSLKTAAYLIDVGESSEWESVTEQVKSTFKTVDLLVLNAAKAKKPQYSTPWLGNVDNWKEIMATNVFGPVNAISALLPLMKEDESPKAIVITGSKQGITNPPGAGNPAYNSSKGAIKILAEHLAHDLRSEPESAHISAHLLVPGWTWTGLTGNTGPGSESEGEKKPQGSWTAGQVAEELEKGLERGSFYIICPDGETDRALDLARMQWAIGDVIEDRPALSRWEGEWKEKAEKAIREDAGKRK